jgi:hypothetical protein
MIYGVVNAENMNTKNADHVIIVSVGKTIDWIIARLEYLCKQSNIARKIYVFGGFNNFYDIMLAKIYPQFEFYKI